MCGNMLVVWKVNYLLLFVEQSLVIRLVFNLAMNGWSGITKPNFKVKFTS